MICPYNHKTEHSVLQWKQEGADECNTSCQQVQTTEFRPMECPKEGCAVWYNGRCHYAAVSLENE